MNIMNLAIIFVALTLCGCDIDIVIKSNPFVQAEEQSTVAKSPPEKTTAQCSDMVMTGDYTIMRNTLKKCAQP